MICIGHIGIYVLNLLPLQTHVGISDISETTEIYRQECTIVCVDTIKIC